MNINQIKTDKDIENAVKVLNRKLREVIIKEAKQNARQSRKRNRK